MEREKFEDVLDLFENLNSSQLNETNLKELNSYIQDDFGKEKGTSLIDAFVNEVKKNLYALNTKQLQETYIREIAEELTYPIEGKLKENLKVIEKGINTHYENLNEIEKFYCNVNTYRNSILTSLAIISKTFEIDFIRIISFLDNDVIGSDWFSSFSGVAQQTENESQKKTKERLTHKQQILLLQTIGFFDLPAIKSALGTQQKGILTGYLLNRNEKNSEEYIRGLHGNLKEDDNKKCNTTKNIQTVNELLKLLGLKEIKVK